MIGRLFIAAGFAGSALLSIGCVMAEKYDAEKARSLNFQRLLAAEEKRTGELDAELKRVKREAIEQDAKSRELTAQLQAVREQLARAQEEIQTARESALHSKSETKDRARAKKDARAEPPKVPIPQAEPPKPAVQPLEGPSVAMEPSPQTAEPQTFSSEGSAGEPRYHAVKSGETLFRIAKRYGRSVSQLKEWNRLPDTNIEVGQRLIVGFD